MNSVPSNLRYSSDHVWVVAHEDGFRIGLTDYAQEAIGEVSAVRLSIELGEQIVEATEPIGEVEAFKAVTDLYMPVTGRVEYLNPSLSQDPTTINSEPYEAGWIAQITPSNADDVESLSLDASDYEKLISGEFDEAD